MQELPDARFGVGANYSSLDGLGLKGYHLWRNLFGQAERLHLDARVASIAYPIDTAQFDYFFGGIFTKPSIFTPDTDLVAVVSVERTLCPTYTEISAIGKLGLTHILSDEIPLRVGRRCNAAGSTTPLKRATLPRPASIRARRWISGTTGADHVRR
ncbi:MAG: hypothetical protein MO846_12345 [Candidatus Devosia symbiotica]|nr:hypothetical protein [Candidatus Devosia symbiotica]